MKTFTQIGTEIGELLEEAGIQQSDPDYGKQYNLTHASLSELGIRYGLDERVEVVMRARGLGMMTDKGRTEFSELLQKLLAMLGQS